MRVTSRGSAATATARTTTALVLLAALALPHPAAAAPLATATGSASSAAPATSSTAADDLVGDVVFSAPSGTFQGQISVSLSTPVSGAQLRYTTDGALPTAQSPLYQGTPLRFTRTTQLRARPFTGATPSGATGTAMYVARDTATAHDLPVVLVDTYGAGKPGREYLDSTTMIFQPGAGGTTSLASAPAVATRAGAKLRGQSSASFDKTPYRLEFHDNADDDADHPVLGMPADSDWVLRGPFPDKSLVREALVYDLGREMGLKAPRHAFVELYVNTDAGPVGANDYQGVYMIVETIKNTKNRLDLKKLKEDDTTTPKIQGGYIWKFEWMAAEEPTLPCTGSACWNYLELVDPSAPNPAQKDWLRAHLKAFNDVLRAPNSADPATGYRAYLDVPSFVGHLIVNEVSRNMDAYVRSSYFHKDRDGKIVAGPLWDFDLTFGVGGYFQNDQVAGWQHQQTRQPMPNDWFPQLLRDPAFVAQVKARWQELRRGPLSDSALQSRIDALTRPLANGAARNFQRWPNLSAPTVGFFVTPTAPTWQGQVQHVRDWLLRRVAWLDSPAGWGGGTDNPPGGAGCTATYTVTNQWQGGFQGEVKVTAGSAPISSWTVTWSAGAGESITQAWNATVTSQGGSVTARNAAHNGAVAAGGSTTFGFLGTTPGTPGKPVLGCASG
ncbi:MULTISPECIES: CotH kinase family protein [Actinosynnema]|uniref:CotH kinase family protein n=1 Tax=Actinosynnema TaxID=40566 RepID=UPI0020A3C045|nr:CotH kinase family protein [Actinosynnema pretiosum]MCP2097609.1 Chitobiase/beta-hexosaminidase C-terminal domain-containing protein [Actinosynnema pretiosum]